MYSKIRPVYVHLNKDLQPTFNSEELSLFRKPPAYLRASVVADDGNCGVFNLQLVPQCLWLIKCFCVVCRKLLRLFFYGDQYKGIRYPVSTELILFHSLAVFQRRKRKKITDEISSIRSGAHISSIFSDLHHKTHSGRPLFSCPTPLLAWCACKRSGAGEGSSGRASGCHASFCLAEILVMLAPQPALAEPLALWFTWKRPQEHRCLGTLDPDDPSTLGPSRQRTSFPQKLHSSWHSQPYPKPCFFTQIASAVLAAGVPVLTLEEGETGRHSFKTTALFHSWVFLCCLFAFYTSHAEILA